MNHPQYLLLIPLLAIAGFYFRRLQLWRPLRVLTLLLLVVTLTDPLIRRMEDGLDLWVLVDRSSSAEETIDLNLSEWKQLLERSKQSSADRIRYVDYAAEVVPTPNAETAIFPRKQRRLTRTGLALQSVLAMANENKRTRVLLFSDGYSTEPLTGVAEQLRRAGIPLDYRLAGTADDTDYRIARVDHPVRVQIGEPYLIEATVLGNVDGEIPISIFRDEEKIGDTTVRVHEGRGMLRFTDRLADPGGHRYEFRIAPELDAHPGNNQYEAWVEVSAGPQVLLVTKYLNDPVAPILRAQGFEVIVSEDPRSLQIGQLTGCKTVILNNVPAYDIPQEFLDSLNFFVTEQGGGLMMAGGKHSFGSGGYYDSAVDDLLPVTMELKSEHRKLTVAMAIVMDRSGSMSMTVPGGQTKMQLANEGSANAVSLLGAYDMITIHAVDSQSHEIVPLLNVGENREDIIDRVRRVESMGGGIFVYTGLEAAWKALREAEVGQRHIILFTDAADSEEPGAYKKLIKDITSNSGSVSVIGLGTRSDPDAAFIEDVAKRGNGRIFFTQNPSSLPNIFAQETVTVARSAFIDEPVTTQATGNWYEIANKDFDWLPSVGGYNLSYTRDGDTAALVSQDEYAAPLVAYGRRGIGRTAAVSFALGGEHSEETRQWEKVGDFLQTANRWLMGEDTPPGIGLRSRLTGTELTIDLIYDTEVWAERFAAAGPRIVLGHGEAADQIEELQWERVGPDRYTVRADLADGSMVRGAVQLGGIALPFGPLAVGADAEWAFDRDRIAELRQVSAASSGRELINLEDAWLRPPAKELAPLRPWLLIALLAAFLLEALITRTGWSLPQADVGQLAKQFGNSRKPKTRPKPNAPKTATAAAEAEAEIKAATAAADQKPTGPASPTTPAIPEEPTDEDTPEARRSRFARAKKRK